MKQTAVEFLHSEYKRIFGDVLVKPSQAIEMADALAQAKEIEKQQIIEAYIECKRQYLLQGNCYPPQFVFKEAEQYYNETFKKK